MDITGVEPLTVPVIFNNPEQIYERKIYPSFLVTRDSIEQDLARWHSVRHMEYIAGTSGSFESVSAGLSPQTAQTVSGFSSIEMKAQTWPFNLFYTISCYARYEHEAIPLLKTILKSFTPYSRIHVIDSLGDTRSYTVFAEGTVQDIGEYVDVPDRLKAYSWTIRVEGELDLHDPILRNTVGHVVQTVKMLK